MTLIAQKYYLDGRFAPGFDRKADVLSIGKLIGILVGHALNRLALAARGLPESREDCAPQDKLAYRDSNPLCRSHHP